MLRAVNVPVTVGGMTVVPGDFIHMDEHGAIKLTEVTEDLENAKKLIEKEAKGREIFLQPDFSLQKWKKTERTESILNRLPRTNFSCIPFTNGLDR